MLRIAHATVAADRQRGPKMLATARRRVDDVPGDVDVGDENGWSFNVAGRPVTAAPPSAILDGANQTRKVSMALS